MKTYRKIIQNIRAGNLSSVYFLAGEEPYFGRKVEEALLQNVVDENAKSFDEIILYGPETSLRDILLQAGRFPMMSQKQLIAVREAQGLFKKENDLKAMGEYLKNPAEHTVLSFRFFGKPGTKVKNVFQKAENAVYLETKALYENQMAEFIMDLFKDFGYPADFKSAMMMTEYVGTDISRAEHELEKLSVVLPAGTKITPAVIEEYVGISKDFNVFELKNAIAGRQFNKAHKIAYFFSQNPKEYPFLMIVSMLYNFFSQLYVYHTLDNKSNPKAVASALKINPYFVREYEKAARHFPMKKVSRVIQVLREADLKAKGVNGGMAGYSDLLNELIYKILN